MDAHSLRRLAAVALIAAGLAASPVAAQDINPEEGWVPPPEEPATEPAGTEAPSESPAWYHGGPTGTDAERPPDHSAEATPAAAPAEPAPAPAPTDGRSDHSRVVGRLAVGFMGATAVPIGTSGFAAPDFQTVTAPALGIRYWLSELVGLDVGLGIGFLGGNVGDGTTSAPIDNAFAMTIHAGVPIAVFHESHYKLIIVPEMNLGFSTGTAYGTSPNLDRGRDGFLFQLGGRLGTEIHFGFMNIPQLSLQASVGLYFEYASANVGPPAGSTVGEVNSRYGLGTTVLGEPWDIFLGALTALYYF